MATKRVGKDGENLKKGKRGAIWEREDQELFAMSIAFSFKNLLHGKLKDVSSLYTLI